MPRLRCLPLALVLAAGMLAGCYTSPVPLADEPQEPVEPSWLGTWVEVGKDKPKRMTVRARGENAYTVLAEDNDGRQYSLLAFATRVGGETVLNVRARGPIRDTWYFVRPRRGGADWHLDVVPTGTLKQKYGSPKELRAAFEAEMRRSPLFGDGYHVRRVGA